MSCMNHNTAVNGHCPASRRTGADRRRRRGARETYIPRSMCLGIKPRAAARAGERIWARAGFG